LDISNLRLILVYPEGTRLAYTYLADYTGNVHTDEPHVVKWGSYEHLLAGQYRQYNWLVKDCLDWINVKYKEKDTRQTETV
jgi:hypothetical protein